MLVSELGSRGIFDLDDGRPGPGMHFNWSLLLVILAVTMFMEFLVVWWVYQPPRKGYTILAIGATLIICAVFAYASNRKLKSLLIQVSGGKSCDFGNAQSIPKIVITIIVSSIGFTGISYLFEVYGGIPLFFSIPEISFGVMMLLAKNLVSHSVIGEVLVVRSSFTELYIPLTDIKAIRGKRTMKDRLPMKPGAMSATASLFEDDIHIILKRPARMKFFRFTLMKVKDIYIDMERPKEFFMCVKEHKANSN